ncbi:O-antigen ligase family protein [Raineyella fluvialis]|uniref:O-antigen ligase domain-containing protein n=1 Tax=Raineyella fluvialis TaxID=2662261 RepID=A0A5Q2FBV6_9ACTN|nr:O-antigen ligase family protein [Raineyella fluvialis]QGF23881.1 O-antigen ligase domain-containing protein [Raineyella fluvialis]
MGALMATVWGRRAVWLMGTLIGVGLALGAGHFMPGRPAIALGVVGVVLALGVTVAEPAMIPLMAMPLLLVVKRVGGTGLDLSVSDAALGVATVTALVFAPRPFSATFRNLLWLSAIYQFAILFTVVANPYASGVVEWAHSWLLVAGALVVGWTVGRSGHARAGLTLVVLTALLLALSTIMQGVVQYSHGEFHEVYTRWPYEMQKNFVGTVLAFAAVVLYARPSWMGWRKGWSVAVFTILIVALLMTQSRQAIVGLAFGLLVILLRGNAHRRRSKAVVLLAVPALVFVATTVRDQVRSGNGFNSANQRITWFQDTVAYWMTSPWVGHGLRYWYRPGEPRFQPPNAEIEMLATAGIVGLIGFLVLIAACLALLWRIEPEYGTLAVAVVLGKVVQGQFDLFWSAVQVSIPFVIAGICLGALELHRQDGTLLWLQRATDLTVPERVSMALPDGGLEGS